jgi:uroporphyrinogen-III synthase
MRPLVILRPEPGASATAEAARALGLQAIAMSLFRVEPVEWKPPEPAAFDAVLFTSANALRQGGDGLSELRALSAHCVGDATAAAAQDAGFEVASSGTSGVESLLETLPSELRLLHLCGADRHMPEAVTQSVTSIAVYRAVELPSPEPFEIEGAIIAVHSPRAARRLAQLADEAEARRNSIAIVAISGPAAAAAGTGWEQVEIASRPTDSALLAIASRLCNKPRP